MNPTVGWSLVGAALLAGWIGYGWRGVVLALSVIVFWLLLQFSRTLRLLRGVAGAPVGRVASTVMLHSKLRTGMHLAEVIRLAGSLGQKLRDEPETYCWRDASESLLEVEFTAGRCSRWRLVRAGDQHA